MRVSPISVLKNNQNLQNSNSPVTRICTNNIEDSFEHSTSMNEKVSFKSRETALLSTASGMQKMLDHFSVFKGRLPESAEVIDLIKGFVLEVNNHAKARGVQMKFSWELAHESNPMDLYNVVYKFEKGNSGFFGNGAFVHGRANGLQELITWADLETAQMIKNKEKTLATTPAMLLKSIKIRADVLESSSDIIDKVQAKTLRIQYLDEKPDVRNEASTFIAKIIDTKGYILHFDEIFPDRSIIPLI